MTNLYWAQLADGLVLTDETMAPIRRATNTWNKYWHTDVTDPSLWGVPGVWQDLEDPTRILWLTQYPSFTNFLIKINHEIMRIVVGIMEHVLRSSVTEYVETKAFATDSIKEPERICTLDSPVLAVSRMAVSESSLAEFNSAWEDIGDWIMNDYLKPYTFRGGWAVGLYDEEDAKEDEEVAYWYNIGGCASPLQHEEFKKYRHYDKYVEMFGTLVLEEQWRFYRRVL